MKEKDQRLEKLSREIKELEYIRDPNKVKPSFRPDTTQS